MSLNYKGKIIKCNDCGNKGEENFNKVNGLWANRYICKKCMVATIWEKTQETDIQAIVDKMCEISKSINSKNIKEKIKELDTLNEGLTREEEQQVIKLYKEQRWGKNNETK